MFANAKQIYATKRCIDETEDFLILCRATAIIKPSAEQLTKFGGLQYGNQGILSCNSA